MDCDTCDGIVYDGNRDDQKGKTKEGLTMDQNSITINGHAYDFTPGQTILEIAQQNNIDIPNLCHLKGTRPTGACRICIVEIEESWGKKLVSSCSTPAKNGMLIHTESPEVVSYRKIYLGLMLDSGNHNCDIGSASDESWTDFQIAAMENDKKEELCPVWGDCELQTLAYRYQVKGRVSGRHREPLVLPVEDDNPFIIRDMSRCILCGRCVAACNERQVNQAIDFGFRGNSGKIIAGTGTTLMQSSCVFCGECVQVCPVGALVPKKAFRDNRFVPTKTVRTTCSFCGVGCQMDVFVQDNTIVKIDGADPDLPPNNAMLCVKGRYGFEFVGAPDRLTTPLIKKDGKQVPASWEEALDFVAKRFTQIKDQHGADTMGVLTSARTTNEDNYIAQKFTRAVLKTNNIDHCARL
jgi:predicted molibdopterin-dependent oxidoreductase YjgC